MRKKEEVVLPKPHKGQLKVLNSTARFKVMCCGRRFGKTLICQIIAIQSMLEGQKIAYVTPSFDLGKEFFKEVVKYFPKASIKTDNKSDLLIELNTGGSLKFLSGEALNSFRGRKFHKVIIDEAAFVTDLENAWYTSIRPTLSDYQGEAIFISTPRGKNFFYTLFLKGKNKEDGYESFHFASNENPYFPPDEFEVARQSIPEAKFNEEYLAIPGENSANPFSQRTIKNNTISLLSENETVVYGIDIAKYNDYTVIIGMDEDGAMTHFDRFQMPWEFNMQKIKDLPSNTMKVMDATGVGDVVFEMLAKDVLNLHPFKFTAQTKPMIMQELIKDAEMNKIKFNSFVADEMFVFEAKLTGTGYVKYEAMQGYHDDAICALAIANHKRKNAFSINNWQLYTV